MAVTITKVLTLGSATSGELDLTDQATGAPIGSGMADSVIAAAYLRSLADAADRGEINFALPVQFGLFVQGTAAGQSWTQGVLVPGAQSGTAAGRAGGSAVLAQAQVFAGVAAGLASVGPSPVALPPVLAGTAAGVGGASATLAGASPVAGTAAGVGGASGTIGFGAETTFVDTFADSSLHARWASGTSGTGSVTETTSLRVIANANSEAAVLLKQSFNRGDVRTFKLDINPTFTTATDQRLWCFAQAASEPSPINADSCATVAMYVLAGGSNNYWKIDYGQDAEPGGYVEWGTGPNLALGTTRRIIIDLSATQGIRVRLVDPANESTVYKDWGWLAWSAVDDDWVGVGNPSWLVIGDAWGSGYGAIDAVVSRFERAV